jgi:hypothetical protein
VVITHQGALLSRPRVMGTFCIFCRSWWCSGVSLCLAVVGEGQVAARVSPIVLFLPAASVLDVFLYLVRLYLTVCFGLDLT